MDKFLQFSPEAVLVLGVWEAEIGNRWPSLQCLGASIMWSLHPKICLILRNALKQIMSLHNRRLLFSGAQLITPRLVVDRMFMKVLPGSNHQRRVK